MRIGGVILWLVVAFLFLVPLNWAWLRASGGGAAGPLSQLLIGAAVCWGIGGVLGYLLIRRARQDRNKVARATLELEQLRAAPLSPVSSGRALLKPGEVAYANSSASLMKPQTVGYAGGSAGASVRVAKGVSIRTSSTRAKAVKGLVSVATGDLVATNARIIFAGDSKSFYIALPNLLSVTPFNDGFSLSDGKSSYMLRIESAQARATFGVILEKLLATSRADANPP